MELDKARVRALGQLRGLAEVKRDADIAEMERLRMGIRAMESQIEQLEQASIDVLAATEAPTAYQRSGKDALWDAWRLSRVRDLTMQLAGLRADLERQGQIARRSVGRHQVIGRLLERHGPGSKPRGY